MKALLYALVGDMVDSRGVDEHRVLHRQLEKTLAALNRRFAAILWAPLGLTKGVDELSGALLTPAGAFELLCQLNLHLYPVRFRFALGWGEVYAHSADRSAGSLDGTGFHAGAAALERARRDRLPLTLGDPPPEAKAAAQAVEALAGLDAVLKEDWTPVVWALAQAMDQRPDATQSELAQRARRTQQAISSAQVRGRFKELKRGQIAVGELLADIHRKTEQFAGVSHGRP